MSDRQRLPADPLPVAEALLGDGAVIVENAMHKAPLDQVPGDLRGPFDEQGRKFTTHLLGCLSHGPSLGV